MSEEKKEATVAEGVAALVLLFGMPLWISWSGFVAKMLWGWFVVPLGLPPIGVAHAAGLGMLATHSTYRHLKSDDRVGHVLAIEILGPGFYLLLGWLAHKVMVG